MSFLALFAAIPQKPKWNQQKVQSIKTEFFTRPNVRAFLKHLTFLLNNNYLPEESDPYVRELHQAGEKIGLRLHRDTLFLPPRDSADTDDDLSVNSLSDRTTSALSISSCGSAAAINSELKRVPYWNEPLTEDDPQLRQIMHEIALKSSASANIFLVEQKRDRLIHAYITLCSRVKRFVLQQKLGDPEITDAMKYSDLKGLFEINYFHSSSFEEIVLPHRKKILQETTTASHPSPSKRQHHHHSSPSDPRHSSSSDSLPGRGKEKESYHSPSPHKHKKQSRPVLRNSASLYFQYSI